MKQAKGHLRMGALLVCLLLVASLLGSWCSVRSVKAAVTMETSHQSMQIGDSQLLEIQGAVGSVSWSSSNPSVASVTQEGVVTTHQMGEAVITASDASGSRAACTITSGYYWGIDVSRHNGTCDWAAIARAGVDFAMIRAGYGHENYPNQVDSQLRANVEGAVENGVPFGLYFYSYATSVETASLEADYLLRILDDYVGEYRGDLVLPIAYDVEESQIINNLDANTVTNMILTFCEKVRDAGYLPMLYSYRSMIQTSMNLTDLQEEGILIWEAYWPTQPDFTQKQSLPGQPGVAPDIWQYTFDGNVPGANTSSGQVDLNLIYMDSPLGQMLGGGELLSVSGVAVDGAGILNWNRQQQAQSIEVHRVSPQGEDVILASLDGESTSYLDNTLGWSAGDYAYYIRITAQDGSTMQSNRVTLTAQTKTYQAQVASYQTNDRLVWDRVNGADSYGVYCDTVRIARLDGSAREYALTQNNHFGVYTVRAYFHCADGTTLYYDLQGGGLLGEGEPEAPQVTVSHSGEALFAQLSWEEAPTAAGYQIWRNGAYFDWTTDSSYTIYFTQDQTDTYQVLVHYTAADGTVRLSSLSDPIYTAFLPEGTLEQPLSLTVQPGEDYIALYWEELPYALGYRVTLNGEAVQTLTETSLLLTGLTPGAAYQVEVIPYYFTAQGETDGTAASAEVTLSGGEAGTLAAPAVTAQNQESYLELSWEPVEQAEAYQVYRDGELLGQTQQTCWQDAQGVLGQAYTYTVRALGQEEGVFGPFSQPVTAARQVLTPQPVSGLSAQTRFDRVTLSWNGDGSATSYQVYRDGELVAEIQETAYEDLEVAADTRYTYTVVAVRTLEGSTALSPETELAVQTPAPLVGSGTLVTMGSQESGVKVTPTLSANDGGLVRPEGWLLYRDGELVTALGLEESYTFYQDTLEQSHRYWIVGYFFDQDGRLWLSQPV